jgi:ATP-dependent Clp protease adaptor protein ClpS
MMSSNQKFRRNKTKRSADKAASFFVVPPIEFSISEWFTQYSVKPFDWHHPSTMAVVTNGAVSMSQENDHQEYQEGDVATEIQTTKPPFYAVVLFNDDYTPMEFVIHVLQQYFGLDLDRATEVMLSVHYEGKGVAAVYPRDIAETKAQLVNRYARSQGHPLLCQIEPQEIE